MIKHPYVRFICSVAGVRQEDVNRYFQNIPLTKNDVVGKAFFQNYGFDMASIFRIPSHPIYSEAYLESIARGTEAVTIELEEFLSILRPDLQFVWRELNAFCIEHTDKPLDILVYEQYYVSQSFLWLAMARYCSARLLDAETNNPRMGGLSLQSRTSYMLRYTTEMKLLMQAYEDYNILKTTTRRKKWRRGY